jgi:hypothetical protein
MLFASSRKVDRGEDRTPQCLITDVERLPCLKAVLRVLRQPLLPKGSGPDTAARRECGPWCVGSMPAGTRLACQHGSTEILGHCKLLDIDALTQCDPLAL